jgi:predicted DNA-binding transcriptional regulator YafY
MNARRLAMMRLFDSRKKFTARELAERFDVSVRTIQRDLEHLQEMGLPLYAEVGVQGGYRVLPNRILPPLQLTQQEALGLFLLLEWLEEVPDMPHGAIRERLADHYYGSLPEDVQDRIERMRNHIAFRQPNPKLAAPFTTLLLQAAVERQSVRFVYRSRAGDRVVEAYPLGIYCERGCWYMPAWREGRVLLYRVDRVREAEALEQTNEAVPALLAWLRAEDTRAGIEVALAFTDFGVRLAETDSAFQGIVEREWRGQVPEEELPFVARKLMSYGPEVVVLAPAGLREMMAELLENGLKQYR